MKATLRWTGEALRFEGQGEDTPWIPIDGGRETGPSPMQTLLLSLAACSAADVVEILGKMRVPLEGLEVRLEGDRAPEPPRRYTAIRILYRVRGVPPEAEDKVQRAVALSREKYCSVVHTLRPETEITSEIVLD
jgi:putative redox protein